jgi:hypothetical protein
MISPSPCIVCGIDALTWTFGPIEMTGDDALVADALPLCMKANAALAAAMAHGCKRRRGFTSLSTRCEALFVPLVARARCARGARANPA